MNRLLPQETDNDHGATDPAIETGIKPPHADGTLFPLALSQREIWLDQVIHEGQPLYNLGSYLHIPCKVDLQRYRQAVDLLARKHDCLRIVLTEENDEDGFPLQTFREDTQNEVVFLDLSQYADPHAAALDWMQERLNEPFKLSGALLWKSALLKIADSCFYAFYLPHHLILDAWGGGLLYDSLGDIYSALEAGRVPDLSAPSYKEFILNEKAYLIGATFQRQKAYWKKRLHDRPARAFLPRDQAEGAPTQSGCCQLSLGPDISCRLQAFAQEQGATPFQVLLAVLYVYLARTTQQDDIVIGMQILNRGGIQAKQTMGLCVSTIAERISCGTGLVFTQLLREIVSGLRRDYRHQRFPLSALDTTAVARAGAEDRLYDVSISYERHHHRARFGSTQCTGFVLQYGNLQTPLTLIVSQGDESETCIDFIYNCTYFEHSEIEVMMARFRCILERVFQVPSTLASALDILPDTERHRLLVEWNATAAVYPADKCVHELFEAQAAERPDAVALVYEEATLSYGALNARANRLAHHLISLGVGPDCLVGLCVERGFDMVVGLLAILKAGGAYVPLDPSYPAERLAYMLGDAAPVAVLTHRRVDGAARAVLQDAASAAGGPALIDMKADASLWADRPAGDPDPAVLGLTPRNLAYVIYTSGSTGQPKGVMNE
ncbi:condensation domain-containing protein, partial [Brucella sp. 22210]|uniref:condensation domain-containing protein n=1 Tax=Brucella sp. 22210 TaxID=3453892 RepID=UPI003F861F68